MTSWWWLSLMTTETRHQTFSEKLPSPCSRYAHLTPSTSSRSALRLNQSEEGANTSAGRGLAQMWSGVSDGQVHGRVQHLMTSLSRRSTEDNRSPTLWRNWTWVICRREASLWSWRLFLTLWVKVHRCWEDTRERSILTLCVSLLLFLTGQGKYKNFPAKRESLHGGSSQIF